LQLRERQLEMHLFPFHAPTPFLHCPPWHLPITTPMQLSS
jgi:hypothetical protein